MKSTPRNFLFAMTLLTHGLAIAQSNPSEILVWEAAGFQNAEISEVDLSVFYKSKPTVSPTHGLDLTSIVFRGSGWTVPEITFRTQDMVDTLAQCRVKITSSKIISVDSLPGLTRFDGQVKVEPEFLDDPHKKEAVVANMLPEILRPLIFYVHSIRTDSAYANLAEAASPPYKDSAVVDTIWIARATIYSEHKYNPHYSVEAHELGHVLGKLQHLYLPHLPGTMTNLMAADLHKLSPILTEKQCMKIRSSNLLKPL